MAEGARQPLPPPTPSPTPPRPTPVSSRAFGLLTFPSDFLDDVAASSESWWGPRVLTDILALCILSASASAWAISSPSVSTNTPTALVLAFSPLLYSRIVGLGLDLCFLACGVGWASRLTRRGGSMGPLFLPVFLRVIDEVAAGLSSLLLLFLAGQRRSLFGAGGAGAIVPSPFVTIFFPLWVGTIVQACVVLAAALAVALVECAQSRQRRGGGAGPLPAFLAQNSCVRALTDFQREPEFDPLAGRRRIPRVRAFVGALGSRILLLLGNAATVPLALRLDQNAPAATDPPFPVASSSSPLLPWSAVFGPFALFPCLAAFAGVWLAVSHAHAAFSSSGPPRPLLLPGKAAAVPVVITVLFVAAACGAATLHEAWTQLDALVGASPSQRSSSLAVASPSRILAPWIAGLIGVGVGSTVLFGPLLTRFRADLARSYGVATPTTYSRTHAAFVAATVTQQRVLTRDGEPPPTFGPVLAPPSYLVRVGPALWRRLIPDDSGPAARGATRAAGQGGDDDASGAPFLPARPRSHSPPQAARSSRTQQPGRRGRGEERGGVELRRRRGRGRESAVRGRVRRRETAAAAVPARLPLVEQEEEQQPSARSPRRRRPRAEVAAQSAFPVMLGGGGLARRTSSAGGDSTCLLCCSAFPDAVLLECGHGGMCWGCAGRLASEGRSEVHGAPLLLSPPAKCPFCRTRVEHFVRIEGADGGKKVEVGGRVRVLDVWG
jgi:hypothetical protein